MERGDRLTPQSRRELGERIHALALVNGLDDSAIVDQLGQHSTDTLGRQTSLHDGGHALNNVRRHIGLAILHPRENVGLKASVLGLLGSGLALGRVLLVELGDTTINELNQMVRIATIHQNLANLGIVLTLGGLTIGIGVSHSIDSFSRY